MGDPLGQIAAELACPLCRRFFDSPVSLPCSHLFCNTCIRDRLQGKGVVLNECPTCRQPAFIRDLTRNPKVANMAQLVGKFMAEKHLTLPSGDEAGAALLEPAASPPTDAAPVDVRVADLEAWAGRWMERPTPSTSSGLRELDEVAAAVLDVLQAVESRLKALGEGAGDGTLAPDDGLEESPLEAEAGPSMQPSMQPSLQRLRRLASLQFGTSAEVWSRSRLMEKLKGFDLATMEELAEQQDAAEGAPPC